MLKTKTQHTKHYACGSWKPISSCNIDLHICTMFTCVPFLLLRHVKMAETLAYCSFVCKHLHWAPPCGKTMSIKAPMNSRDFHLQQMCKYSHYRIGKDYTSLHRGHLKTFNKTKLNTNIKQISWSTNCLLTHKVTT